MDKINQLLKSLSNDSSDVMNWNINLDDYVLKIIAFDEPKTVLIVGSGGKLLLVNKWTGKTIHYLKIPVDMVFFAESKPSQKTVIVGTDRGLFAINTDSFDCQHFYKENKWFEKGSWQNNYFLSSYGKTLLIFDTQNEPFDLLKKDDSFTSTISAIASNGSSFLVSNYGGIREYNSADGFDNYKNFPWQTSLLELAWSPDKKYISSGTQERNIHFWPYPFEPEADFEMSGYPSKVNQICWTDDAHFLALNCDEEVHIWSFENGPPMNQAPQVLKCALGKIVKIHFKNSLLVACSQEGFVISFLPDVSSKLVNIRSVDGEITELCVDAEEETMFVGTNEGLVSSFDIDI